MANSEGLRQRNLTTSPDTDDAGPIPRKGARKLKKPNPVNRCCACLYRVTWITLLIVLALFILLTLKSSPIDSEAFTLPPPRPWTGPLAPNNKLQSARKLLEGKVDGPESLAIKDGRIYTGTHDGKIIEIINETDINILSQLGTPPCGSRDAESRCGRPLGLRFFDDKLYVTDGYFGLFEVDITKETKPVELVSNRRSYNRHPMRFTNDLERLDNGDFLFTDSSYRMARRDYASLILEGKGCGRLLWFNPISRMSDLSLDGLYFANGLQLSPAKDFLLIAESSRYRILKYYLTGPKTGTKEVFIDNLPGVPDNIRPSRNGGYWVGMALVGLRKGSLPIIDFLAPLPWLRNTIAKLVDPMDMVKYLPGHGLVIELNQEGEIVQSLQDPTGEVVPSVSEVLDTGDALYLGSYHAPYLLKLDY